MPEKYQDEIEEILRRAGEAAPTEPSQEGDQDRGRATDRSSSSVRASRDTTTPAATSNRRSLPRLSPGKLLLAGIVVFLLSALLTWPPGIFIGLGMVIVAYLLFFVTPRSTSSEQWWRGRRMDEVRSPWDRIKNWLKSG